METVRIAEIDAAGTGASAPRDRASRAEALVVYQALELPSEADEEWRYTDLSGMKLGELAVSVGPPPSPEAVSVAQVGDRLNGRGCLAASALEAVAGAAGLAWIRDGQAVAVAGVEGPASGPGAEISALSEAPEASAARLWSVASFHQDKFAALAGAFGGDGASLRIPAGARLERPLVVVVETSEGGIAALPHILVELGEGASAEVAVFFVGSPESASLAVPTTEIILGPSADLRHLSIQEGSDELTQIETLRARLGAGSSLRTAAVAFGGRLARLRAECELAGEGAVSAMQGLYFGTGDQRLDFRTLQRHAARRTTSSLDYRGAVAGRAGSVYSGLIRVEREAQKTDGFQSNRTLVLSEGASAESIPNLEILANDVRCSHASATGPIDEEELYYLGCRGIPPDVAERLLVAGFFEELVGNLPLAFLAPHLRELLAAKLSVLDAAEESGGA